MKGIMTLTPAPRRDGFKWALVLLAGASVAVLLWAARDNRDMEQGPTASTAASAATAVSPARMTPTATVPASPEAAALVRQQQQAAAAALRQPGTSRSGLVTERPDYVSPLEWQVLQAVASHSPQPAVERTRLVDKLLFAKQLDAWHALAGSPDLAQRQALANQLLADLPGRVSEGAYDLAQARQLQGELLEEAESDPVRRSQRAATEAARLPEAPVHS